MEPKALNIFEFELSKKLVLEFGGASTLITQVVGSLHKLWVCLAIKGGSLFIAYAFGKK